MPSTPSASYSLTLRVKLSSRAGTLGQLATAIGRAGGDIGAIDIVSVTNDFIIRDVTVNAGSSEHGEKIVEAVNDIDGIEVIHVSDLTFLMHIGGKIEVVSKLPLKTRADLCRISSFDQRIKDRRQEHERYQGSG
jgi:malate dehydrogenase (oxaloacetate-decarboxylating)